MVARDKYFNVKSGGSSWKRNPEWIQIPEISIGEEVIYMLYAVYEDEPKNYIAFSFQSNYEVDWGDGVIESYSSGVISEHEYLWSNVGNITSDGYKQVLIKVTPQLGFSITNFNLQNLHTSQTEIDANYLDIIINLPNVTTFSLGGYNIEYPICERVWFKEIHQNITSLVACFKDFHSLVEIPLFNTQNVVSFSSCFFRCYSLRKLPEFNYSNLTTLTGLRYYLYNCYSINSDIIIDCVNITDLTESFIRNQANMGKINLVNTSGVTNILRTINNNNNIEEFIMDDCSSVTNITGTFDNCFRLKKLILPGITIGFSILNSNLREQALNDLFISLGTASGSQTIIVTGNPGSSTCDTSIATGKGWTVTI